MKKYFYSTVFKIASILILVLFSKCNKEPEEEIKPETYFTFSEVHLSPLGQTKIIGITNVETATWSIEIEPVSDWLVVEKQDQSIMLTAGVNEQSSGKSTIIKLYVEGVFKEELIVNQSKSSYHVITIDEVNFDKSTGTILCNELEKSSYTGDKTDIIVPSTLDGVTVTSIGEKAFVAGEAGITKLTNVAFSSTVTSIGKTAFYGNSIESIVIPSSVVFVGEFAFGNNQATEIGLSPNLKTISRGSFSGNQITNLEIPEGVDSILLEAFMFNNLTSVTIPSSVKYIGIQAFNHNLITEVNGLPSNGLIYQQNGFGNVVEEILVSYGGENRAIDFIPESVKTITDYAFHFSNIESVIIPNGVTQIGRGAFQANNITSISIPSNVRNLEVQAFSGNPRLSSVSFESNSNILSIGKEAFYSCDESLIITLPSNANQEFYMYESSTGTRYNTGENISLFLHSYHVIDSDGTIIY